jgi:ribosomal protein uS13
VARIAGVDLPKNKRMEIALTYIYGIGRSKAQYILERANINFDKKTDDLADSEITAIRNIIDKEHKVEGDLRREVSMALKRLMDKYQCADKEGPETVHCRQKEIIHQTGIRRMHGKTGQENRKEKRKKEYTGGDCTHSVDL